jgi:hypothetical protein
VKRGNEMFIYAHWPRNGNHIFHAFHKEDSAANFALSQINTYVQNELRHNYSGTTIPKELVMLKDYIDVSAKDKENPKTISHAVKAIELYEEYMRYVMGVESSMHTIQDLKVVE